MANRDRLRGISETCIRWNQKNIRKTASALGGLILLPTVVTGCGTGPYYEGDVINCAGNNTNVIPTYPGTPNYSEHTDPKRIEAYQRVHASSQEYIGPGTILCLANGKQLVLTQVAENIVSQMLQSEAAAAQPKK